MASFHQWRRLFEQENEIKRLTYLVGPERLLAEEILDAIRKAVNPHDLDYAYMSAASVKDRDIYSQLNQYPLDPLRKRLVVVRECDKIKKWDQLTEWLLSRHIPQTVAVFIDSRLEVDTTTPHMERVVKSGRLVKCGPLNEEDALLYIHAKCEITSSAAKLLWQRTGSNLRLAADVAKKATLFRGTADERVVMMLTELAPADDFLEALLRMDKATALNAIAAVPEDEISRIIGSLDYRLGLLHHMHSAMQRNQSIRELVSSTRISPFLVKQMLPYVKYYDRSKIRSCVDVLAFADTNFQNGARIGLLETVTATW